MVEAVKAAQGVIGDIRNLLQDMVTPDLKATVVKLDGLSKDLAGLRSQIDERYKDLQAKVESRLSSQDTIAQARHNELVAKLDTFNVQLEARFDTVIKQMDLDKRLSALEGREKEPQRKSA
jgi:chaperonin cofactor prefoldin